MKSIIATLAFASIAFGDAIWKQEFTQYDGLDHKAIFHAWKQDFNRNYANVEEEVHKYIQFLENLKFICETNGEDLTYKLRLNQFGDMDGDEFRRYVHGPSGSCMRPPETKPSDTKLVKTMEDPNAPASIDWTNYNGVDYVTPVKNQGSCGSCWAFATTGSLECRYAIAHNGQLNSLSEQQLVDCSTSYGNYGCDGGWWYNAYAYIEAVGGLCTEAEYPYMGVDGTCKQSTCGTYDDKMTAYADVTADDEPALLNAAATGCVAVGVEADQSSFQFYSSGVLTGNCGTSIDHGVLVVGYGVTSTGQDYWKVKNSWGMTWGDQGYIYICRSCNKNGAEGECGINMYPAYPNQF